MVHDARKSKRKKHHVLIRLLRIVVALYLAAIIFALSCENSMIYFPTRYPNGDWTLPDRVQEVSFRTRDGETIVAWWFPAENPRATLLFSHGNGGDIIIRAGFANKLRDEGYSVFLYDYRGYGKSTGSPHEAGLYLDSQAAYDYLRNVLQVPASEIVLFGESLGAAVSIDLATRRECAGLVLLSPFTKFGEMAWRAAPIPVGWVLRSRYDSIGKIRKIHIPAAIVHGTEDTLVPITMGHELFNAHPGRKQFFEVARAGHNDLVAIGSEPILNAVAFVVN
ncbi:MAG: alpha/beta hydrolase [Fimbriimonadales bacterium]|nr:alpha/beta hydrolase [Fimbriimonadales bacterium]